MLTKERLSKLLEELSKDSNPNHLVRNHAIFGEVLHAAFLPGSALWAAYEAMGKRLSDIRSEDGEKTEGGGRTKAESRRVATELQELAKAANKLLHELGPSYPETVRSNSEREVEQLVNQAFYKSQPYNFAKWILLAGLVFIGVGSGTFAGFSLQLWDRAKEAQQKLDDANQKYNQFIEKIAADGKELEKRQQDAFDATQRAIQLKTAQYDAMVKDELGKAQQVFDQNVNAASAVIEQQKSKIISDTGAADSFIDGKKKDVIATVNAASDAVNDQKDKFGKGLDLLLEQAKAKVVSAVAEQVAVIGEAAKNGTQKIGDETQKKLDSLTRTAQTDEDSLNNAAAKKRAELDDVADRNATALHDALNSKLSDLNGKSNDAAKSIGGIVSAMAAQETNFVNNMNSRLSDWDQRVALELKRNDDVAQSLAEITSRTNGLDVRLTALQASSSAALDVAAKLSSGTATGDLPHIGAILERSAGLIILSIGIAFVAFVFSGLTLISLRHRSS
jgi:hypothetical protein